MSIPSGSGSEILYRGSISAQSTDATAFRWDKTNPTVGTETYVVPANHIITVISITICEVAAAAGEYLTVNDGASDIHLLNAQSISASSTFVWNDKIVLVGGDKLIIDTTTAANLDVLYTFIDQDWS